MSNDLTQMVNFHTWIPGCDSRSLALLDFFLSFDTSIYSTVAFPRLGNSDHTFVSVDFPSNSKGISLFIALLMTTLTLIGMVLVFI